MSRKSILLVLVFFIDVVSATAGFEVEITQKTPLLHDGFVMNGVDGNLVGPDSNDVWFFELTSDVNDNRTIIKAGTKLEMHPSSALEKMTADRKTRTTAAYRLWNGRVTKYKGRNYIFPNFFLPISKAKKPAQNKDSLTEPEPGRALAVDDPNDVLTMPREVIEKLRLKRSAPSVRLSAQNTEHSTQSSGLLTEHTARSTNLVFVDRTGFLVDQDDDRLVFVPYALGRNVQNLSLNLLPCAVLELTELKQAAEPDRVRFKIAGSITKYKGENYLLLEKATRTYSHGNFGK
jgi:hypothetical protein